MTTYKPGDVAMVSALNKPEPYRAYFDGKTWREYGFDAFCVDSPATIRPLVVLDIKEPAALVEYLKEATDGFSKAAHGMDAWSGRQPIRDITDQIAAQMKPPRIPEPGLWGVVEAEIFTLPRRRWVHHEEGHWVCDTGAWRYWSDLIDPVLVRDGVAS